MPVQCNESPKPQNADVVGSLLLACLRKRAGLELLGKSFDLKSAYKQLGIAESSLWASYVAVYNPRSRKPEVFHLKAVPFGATRSVYCFLRVAFSLMVYRGPLVGSYLVPLL